MAFNLESIAINQNHLSLPYITDGKESKGYEEINSYYYPRGPIKRVISYFRGSGGLIMYTGNCEFYDFDHIARNILGKQSFESDVQRTDFERMSVDYEDIKTIPRSPARAPFRPFRNVFQ